MAQDERPRCDDFWRSVSTFGERKGTETRIRKSKRMYNNAISLIVHLTSLRGQIRQDTSDPGRERAGLLCLLCAPEPKCLYAIHNALRTPSFDAPRGGDSHTRVAFWRRRDRNIPLSLRLIFFRGCSDRRAAAGCLLSSIMEPMHIRLPESCCTYYLLHCYTVI